MAQKRIIPAEFYQLLHRCAGVFSACRHLICNASQFPDARPDFHPRIYQSLINFLYLPVCHFHSPDLQNPIGGGIQSRGLQVQCYVGIFHDSNMIFYPLL